MMTIAKKSLPLLLGKGRLPAYGLQTTLPKADETVKSTLSGFLSIEPVTQQTNYLLIYNKMWQGE